MIWLLVFTVLLNLVIIGGGVFLKSYLDHKARNLASKEDLSHLTHLVEGVKSDFRQHEELVRATLGYESKVMEIQLGIELQAYRDLWQRFLALERILIRLHSLTLTRGTSAVLIPDTYSEFLRDREALGLEAENLEPFIDQAVYRVLRAAVVDLRAVAAESFTSIAHTQEERDALVKRWIDQVGTARRTLAEALRQRLFGAADGRIAGHRRTLQAGA